MVALLWDCKCETCKGGHTVPGGNFGGSFCMCGCHDPDGKNKYNSAGQLKSSIKKKPGTQSKISRLRLALKKEHENFLAVHRDNMKLAARNVELKTALEKYGRHLDGCIGFKDVHGNCPCGLSKAKGE